MGMLSILLFSCVDDSGAGWETDEDLSIKTQPFTNEFIAFSSLSQRMASYRSRSFSSIEGAYNPISPGDNKIEIGQQSYVFDYAVCTQEDENTKYIASNFDFFGAEDPVALNAYHILTISASGNVIKYAFYGIYSADFSLKNCMLFPIMEAIQKIWLKTM